MDQLMGLMDNQMVQLNLSGLGPAEMDRPSSAPAGA